MPEPEIKTRPIDKDLEFFRFVWSMMRFSEGYVVGLFFWVGALIVAGIALGAIIGVLSWVVLWIIG